MVSGADKKSQGLLKIHRSQRRRQRCNILRIREERKKKVQSVEGPFCIHQLFINAVIKARLFYDINFVEYQRIYAIVAGSLFASAYNVRVTISEIPLMTKQYG